MTIYIRESPANFALGAIAFALTFIAFMTFFAFAGAGEIVVDHGCVGWDLSFSRPLGIFFDAAREECYVADTGNHQVVVCDRNGGPVHRFDHFVTNEKGESVLGEPRCVVVDRGGRIFLTDNASAAIDVLDPAGRTIATITPPVDACPFDESFELLALGPDGIYASLSCETRRIAVIDGDLNVARVVGLEWKNRSEKACITGLAVDSQGGIHVTDACASEMVQAYDPDGRLVRSFGAHDTGLENFSFASGIALMRDGNIWVVDTLRHVVSLFTPEGQRLATVGGKGVEPGELQYPTSVATDGVGRIFVAERAGNRYQCYLVGGDVLGSVLPAQRQSGMLLERSLGD